MTSSDGSLLSTGNALSFMQWQLLLEHQVAEYWPYELEFLLASETWRNASRVLDVGCGNGHYLTRLISHFPEKNYAGIDISSEHISAAQSNPRLSGVAFTQADLSAFQPAEKHDVVLLRLVVQHLDGLQAALQSVRNLVHQDSAVFIIEPDPASFFNHPPTPKFAQLLIDYAMSETVQAKTRANLSGIEKELSDLPGWRIEKAAHRIAPRVGPFSNASLLQIFSLWIDIFEGSKAVESDFDGVRQEIEEWASSPTAFNRLGLQLYELKPA